MPESVAGIRAGLHSLHSPLSTFDSRLSTVLRSRTTKPGSLIYVHFTFTYAHPTIPAEELHLSLRQRRSYCDKIVRLWTSKCLSLYMCIHALRSVLCIIGGFIHFCWDSRNGLLTNMWKDLLMFDKSFYVINLIHNFIWNRWKYLN